MCRNPQCEWFQRTSCPSCPGWAPVSCCYCAFPGTKPAYPQSTSLPATVVSTWLWSTLNGMAELVDCLKPVCVIGGLRPVQNKRSQPGLLVSISILGKASQLKLCWVLKRSASLVSLAYIEVVGISTLNIAEKFWSGVLIADQGSPPLAINLPTWTHIVGYKLKEH